MRRDVFQAIADPIRRDIISLLSKEMLTVNGVAEHFDISRPAISKHIKILMECGLVTIHQNGRERYCQIKPETLQPIADWVNPYKQLWENKLDHFETYLMDLKKKTDT